MLSRYWRRLTLFAVLVFASSLYAQAPSAAPLGSADCLPTPQSPAGWRGDGTGRYPAAQPPLKWSRESAAVKELRYQLEKPKDGDTGKPLSLGVAHEWLVAGLINIPEGKTAKDDFDGEDKLEPSTGDKLGELPWQRTADETSWVNLWPLFGDKKPADKDAIAYAHTWLHSENGKPVYLQTMFSNTSKIWLNGKPLGVFTADGSRNKLALEKGWNRLLFRVSSRKTEWTKNVIQWWYNAAFYGVEAGKPDEYTTQNILWSTPLPDNGPGVSSPIAVGDKLFLQAERGVLLCIDRKTGKPLWARSSTYADAAGAAERAANAAEFADIDAKAAKIKEALLQYCEDPAKYHKLISTHLDSSGKQFNDAHLALEAQINAAMKKLNSEKYTGQTASEAGEAGATPASDGASVYAVFGTGVVACFDLEGNRRWTTALDCKEPEHGYCASPTFINGMLVVKSSGALGAAILDAKTGKLITQLQAYKNRNQANYATPYSTPLAFKIGDDFAVALTFGVTMGVKDGKLLNKDFMPGYLNAGDGPSPAMEGRRICIPVPGDERTNYRFVFASLPERLSDPLKFENPKTCTIDVRKFPAWFSYFSDASPLLHEGLAYFLSIDGVLTVADTGSGEIVYQKMLDLAPWMIHNGIIRGGCSGSPTLAGNRIFIFDNQGTAIAIEPGRTFKQVARNRLEQMHYRWGPARNECFMSNPLFIANRLYLRGENNLYCIGEK